MKYERRPSIQRRLRRVMLAGHAVVVAEMKKFPFLSHLDDLDQRLQCKLDMDSVRWSRGALQVLLCYCGKTTISDLMCVLPPR